MYFKLVPRRLEEGCSVASSAPHRVGAPWDRLEVVVTPSLLPSFYSEIKTRGQLDERHIRNVYFVEQLK